MDIISSESHDGMYIITYRYRRETIKDVYRCSGRSGGRLILLMIENSIDPPDASTFGGLISRDITRQHDVLIYHHMGTTEPTMIQTQRASRQVNAVSGSVLFDGELDRLSVQQLAAAMLSAYAFSSTLGSGFTPGSAYVYGGSFSAGMAYSTSNAPGEQLSEPLFTLDFVPHGLFDKAIKKYVKELTFEEQIEKIKQIKGINNIITNDSSASITSIISFSIDLQDKGMYEVKIYKDPWAKSVHNSIAFDNPFISSSSGHICLGNLRSLYNNAFNSKNYLECCKIIIAVLGCDDDSRGYRKWSNCDVPFLRKKGLKKEKHQEAEHDTFRDEFVTTIDNLQRVDGVSRDLRTLRDLHITSTVGQPVGVATTNDTLTQSSTRKNKKSSFFSSLWGT